MAYRGENIDIIIKDWRVRDTLKNLMNKLLQSVHKHLNARVNVSSGYRSYSPETITINIKM